jgi:hypothetical protein
VALNGPSDANNTEFRYARCDSPDRISALAGGPGRALAVDRLVPFARNARTHTPAQIDQIAASIREWGWTVPILVDENGTILAGHARVLAAHKLGITEIPVIVARGWTEAQKRAYTIADNKLTLNSGWDEDLLRNELADLKLQNFELELLGFDDTELERILNARSVGATDPDDVPPVPGKPAARPGDIWQLGRHLLLCGDATSAEDVGRLLAGVNPHLCVSDPPYGVEYDPSWRERDLECWKKPRSLGAVQNDNHADWSAAWRLFSGDVIYAWSPTGASMIEHYQALVAAGFEIRVQIIWAKPHFPIGRGNTPCIKEKQRIGMGTATNRHYGKSTMLKHLKGVVELVTSRLVTEHKSPSNACGARSKITPSRATRFSIPSLDQARRSLLPR